ncbi:MAG: alanine racemase [Phycisphaerae bacterium]|nr:alanine racemase [Phycisphaerae bacterium]
MKVFRTQQYIRPDLQAHIFSKDLLDNVRKLRSLCPARTKFCAVVKANAYGHGITEIVNILNTPDVDAFAVATFYEALHIAPLAGKRPILILEPLNPVWTVEQIRICAREGFECVLASTEALDYIRSVLADTALTLRVHLNIETGMGRCGVEPELAATLLDRIADNGNIRLVGVFTHFATADEEDLSYADQQIDRFECFLGVHKLKNRPDVTIHASNSAGTIKLPQAHYDMVRCGISMYGYYSRRMSHPPIQLKPVLRLEAPVVQLRHIPAGHPVSYGCSFVPTRDTHAAIIPLGYADGYRRCFSNRAAMKIGPHAVPVIGRVCMDQLILDVTDIPSVELGQMVTVLDNDHDSPCSAYALADWADTICYEILTFIHAHVNRIVH